MNIYLKSSHNNQELDKSSSFIGGKPLLPNNIVVPECKLCGQEQTFFLQIAFPESHKWFEQSLAIFSCTSCADENYLIPEMLSIELYNANIPSGFLESYQRNFSLLVFDTNTCVIKQGYVEKIKYKPAYLSFNDEQDILLGKMNNTPNWLIEDESPNKYDDKYEFNFLFQLNSGLEFNLVDNAPRQIEIDIMGMPSDSPYKYYQLFIGNELYLFGVEDYKQLLVYAITQI